MAAYAEIKGVPRHSLHQTFIGTAHRQADTCEDALKSVGGAGTVEIAAAEPTRRLGTGWRWWFSETIHVPIRSQIEFRFQGPRHLLAMYYEGVRKSGETSIEGLPSSKLRRFAHKLTFVPAGCAFRERHEAAASICITFLYLDRAALQRPEAGYLLPRIFFDDALVWDTASKLRGTIESGRDKSPSYLAALSDVLGHELSCADQSAVREPTVHRGGLARWQKRVVMDYIEQHLGDRVCLSKLAELARLSLHHFCRAFKYSFGIPAHQYQVHRRMEVAKLLLADPASSITDIGLSLGYAQTSSFSSAFRKTTGWTPTLYRREFSESDRRLIRSPSELPDACRPETGR
ncbi:AraC family transcriptional regulator [Bradyrhizobium sp. Tv2a-2]|uniref:helix-turn-helix transcriptional regulator n=1 Tax=Bradyrhizobium sp. Tv2a-2 TaxID=113395 RepID=UPI0009FE2D30|nr:AraC family transcriptional regulator [Bradyrhizobium sp. Tv2a-2]